MIKVGALAGPLAQDGVDVVHLDSLASKEGKLSSVESNLRKSALIASVTPVMWATTYPAVEWLPPDRPLFTSLVRALPAGLLILAWRRQLPSGQWWWRAGLLGLCSIGLFFPLLFLGAYLLPAGLASTLQAASPVLMVFLAWWLLRERPRLVSVLAAIVGIIGVALLVLRAPEAPDPLGVVGALGSMTVATLGIVMIKRWKPPVDMITFTSWQLVAGGLFLLPVAFLIEGPPPSLDGRSVLALLWIALPGTALAYVCWFVGMRELPANSVAIIGLLNPVVATLLGVIVLHEQFGPAQALGLVLVLGSVLIGSRVLRIRRTPGAGPAAPPSDPARHRPVADQSCGVSAQTCDAAGSTR